jgi:ketol-acid reductoisomerase
MPATIYYDNDADLSVLKGKTIAILAMAARGMPRRRTSATAASA